MNHNIWPPKITIPPMPSLKPGMVIRYNGSDPNAVDVVLCLLPGSMGGCHRMFATHIRFKHTPSPGLEHNMDVGYTEAGTMYFNEYDNNKRIDAIWPNLEAYLKDNPPCGT